MYMYTQRELFILPPPRPAACTASLKREERRRSRASFQGAVQTEKSARPCPASGHPRPVQWPGRRWPVCALPRARRSLRRACMMYRCAAEPSPPLCPPVSCFGLWPHPFGARRLSWWAGAALSTPEIKSGPYVIDTYVVACGGIILNNSNDNNNVCCNYCHYYS